jgi:hypothetical protein
MKAQKAETQGVLAASKKGRKGEEYGTVAQLVGRRKETVTHAKTNIEMKAHTP